MITLNRNHFYIISNSKSEIKFHKSLYLTFEFNLFILLLEYFTLLHLHEYDSLSVGKIWKHEWHDFCPLHNSLHNSPVGHRATLWLARQESVQIGVKQCKNGINNNPTRIYISRFWLVLFWNFNEVIKSKFNWQWNAIKYSLLKILIKHAYNIFAILDKNSNL